MEGEEGEDIQRDTRALLNVETSLSEKSHGKSIKADPIHSLGSCLGEKGE